jgi:hypothetical protein
MQQVVTGEIPEEPRATCEDCAMSVRGSDGSPPGAAFFNPKTKCCTFTPQFHNFLVGRVLSDPDPATVHGKKSMAARIEKRSHAITPVGVSREAAQEASHGGNPELFGKSLTVRCPHYVDEGKGFCGLWKHRESVCSTWFCKHERGGVGMNLWQALQQLLREVQETLARWCMLELEITPQGMGLLFPTVQSRARPDGPSDADRYRIIWGKWVHREHEFYVRCGELVTPLPWSEVREICGPQVQIYERVTQEAYRLRFDTQLPKAVRVHRFQTSFATPEFSYLWSYSPNDPLRVEQKVVDVLHYFDARPLDEALQIIREESGVTVDTHLVRTLLDYGILEEVSSPLG